MKPHSARPPKPVELEILGGARRLSQADPRRTGFPPSREAGGAYALPTWFFPPFCAHIRATISLVASPAFAKEVAFIRDEAHLTTEDIAAATGAAPSTARAWVALTRVPSGERARRVAELSAIVERLLRVMEPEYIPVWMNKPIPALDDEKPLDLISRGDYRQVAEIISALEEPVAA
jgi:uncharacterized protein (DUF2384 family)